MRVRFDAEDRADLFVAGVGTAGGAGGVDSAFATGFAGDSLALGAGDFAAASLSAAAPALPSDFARS
ncbi:MAG: hypothetical protein ACKVX7_01460 [Planctomycetota bacterium]